MGEEHIPYISLAATVNMAGGQPIAMENLLAVRELAQKYKIRIIIDSTRAVENAYFIQQRNTVINKKAWPKYLRKSALTPTVAR